MAKYYMGQLQGVEMMEQCIMNINQQGWDKVMKKPHFKTVNQVAREFQQMLQEVSEHTNHNEIPDLQQTYYQALRNELKKKLVIFLTPAPPLKGRSNQGRTGTPDKILLCTKSGQPSQTILQSAPS
jgi:hypothetical protein